MIVISKEEIKGVEKNMINFLYDLNKGFLWPFKHVGIMIGFSLSLMFILFIFVSLIMMFGGNKK